MKILIFLPFCISLSIEQEFGNYSLYPESVAFAPLLDYFSGYSMSFSIECTPSLKNSTIIQTSGFSVADRKVFITKLPRAKVPFYKMPSRWVENYAYSFYFTSSEVICVRTYQVIGESIELWNIVITSTISGFSLVDIEAIWFHLEL